MDGKHTIPNLLHRTHEVQGDRIRYRFGNGLVLTTETLKSANPLRILGLGSPQSMLLNYMLNFSDTIRNKDVFEPFAGSGVLGLMALQVGAQYAAFLDINPRAVAFQTRNAGLNHFQPEQFTCHTGDIRTFWPARKFDLLFANPPFVPTPQGLEGTVHANGGPEGNTLVQVLLERLEDFLKPTGEAFICVFQLVREGKPLVRDLVARLIDGRAVDIIVAQEQPIDLARYCQIYEELFPRAKPEIARWQSGLTARLGGALGLSHYVVHIGPYTNQPTVPVMTDKFAETFGDELLIRFDLTDLARVRIGENVLRHETR